MILTVFRSRLRPGAAERGYHRLADEMERRARSMPGFVDFKTFAAEDGERVSLVVFDNLEHHDAWRDDLEHRAAQRRGREDFYADYQVLVARVIRERRQRP